MFLKKTTQKNGRINLSITQAYRENGKSKSRTVKNLGFLDELEQEFNDPIAHFKVVCEEMTAEYKERTAPITLTIHPAQKVDMRSNNRKNVGCAIPMAIYDSLGIETVLNNRQATSKIRFDLNAVMRLLINERLFRPGSKKSAYENKDRYFYKSNFTDDDLYRALDVFASVKDSLIAAANKGTAHIYPRDTSNVFYDVTNYYFEGESDEMRVKGVSKEHRPNPIIQMGLLQDANALPMTYKLFAGNTHDSQTLLDVLDDMKRDFKVERVVCVADKGLNCSDNIAATIGKGDGFVYSQSIRGTKSTNALREWTISDEGYKTQDNDTFKCKSKQGYKIITVEDEDGKKTKTRIDVKYVAFWSLKYEQRARHDRNKTLEKAYQLIKSPSRYTRATHLGAAKYVDGIAFDKKTGECLDSGVTPTFNAEALAADEACDGFYLIVTSETGWSDDKIIDTYRGLWQIEETFKITKSDLEFRPVYVHKQPHVEAHFLTCYISLVIVRLMQLLTGRKYSAASMIDDLSHVNCSLLEDNWWHFDHRTEITDELFALIGETSPVRYMRTGDIKTLLKKKKF
jgi:Transposase